MKLKPANRERLLTLAREMYADPSNDDVEIDDDAQFSRAGSRGVWVQAWVYVSAQEFNPRPLYRIRANVPPWEEVPALARRQAE